MFTQSYSKGVSNVGLVPGKSGKTNGSVAKPSHWSCGASRSSQRCGGPPNVRVKTESRYGKPLD